MSFETFITALEVTIHIFEAIVVLGATLLVAPIVLYLIYRRLG